jgi:hypothetical protein
MSFVGAIMPFWVYGRDSETDQPTDPMFSQADTEDAARAEATSQGLIVERVEPHIEEEAVLPTAQPAATRAHQLTANQHQIINDLAWYLRVFGAILIATGILQVIAGLLASSEVTPLAVLGGVLGLILGGVTISAAGAFSRIGEPPGSNMEKLMVGLSRLTSFYAIQVWLVGIVLTVVGVMIVLALIDKVP